MNILCPVGWVQNKLLTPNHRSEVKEKWEDTNVGSQLSWWSIELVRSHFEAYGGMTDLRAAYALEPLVGVQLLYWHGAIRNLNPGVWTTSIKLGAKLEGFLETDVHWPSSGPEKFTATEPPDLCWPEGMGPHTGCLVVVFWIVRMRDWAECTAKIGELGMLLPLHQLLCCFWPGNKNIPNCMVISKVRFTNTVH